MSNAAQISRTLDDQLKKAPAQKENVTAIKKFIATDGGKNLPNSRRPILYAIGGVASVGKVMDYSKKLQADRAKDPMILALTWSWTTQLMAGPPPWAAPRPNPPAQLAQYAFFDRSQTMPYAHEIFVDFRFPAYIGGSGDVIRRAAVINDTGSNTQSLKRSDWNALNTYRVVPNPGIIMTAGGPHPTETVILEIRVVKSEVRQNATGQRVRERKPLTHWFSESLRIVDDECALLSGETMRNYLYFATAPGNDWLMVSQRKQAIVDGLPVVQPPLP